MQDRQGLLILKPIIPAWQRARLHPVCWWLRKRFGRWRIIEFGPSEQRSADTTCLHRCSSWYSNGRAHLQSRNQIRGSSTAFICGRSKRTSSFAAIVWSFGIILIWAPTVTSTFSRLILSRCLLTSLNKKAD